MKGGEGGQFIKNAIRDCEQCEGLIAQGCKYMRLHAHVCVYVCVRAFLCVLVRTSHHSHTHTRTCTHTHIHTHTHTLTYTYTPTHTYTHIRTHKRTILHIPTHLQGMTLPPAPGFKKDQPATKRVHHRRSSTKQCPRCDGSLEVEDVEGDKMVKCSNTTCTYTGIP
jgi:hypothetical protein